MQITIDRAALLAALKPAAMVSPAKHKIPVLSYALLTVDADNALTIETTDLEMACDVTTRGADGTAGRVCAQIHDLIRFVRTTPKGSDVTLATAGDKLIVASGGSRIAIETWPEVDMPRARGAIGGILYEAPINAALAAVANSMSSETTRCYLNGAYVHVAGQSLRYVSTDGHRLAWYSAPLPAGAGDSPGVIVPSRTIKTLLKLLTDGPAAIEVSPKRYAVAQGGWRIVSKIVDGTFPDYERVMPAAADRPNVLTVGADAMRAALAPMVDRVRLALGPHGCTISTDSAAAAPIGTYQGAVLDIGFEPRYLIGALAGAAGNVTLRFGGAGAPIRVEISDNLLRVVMPKRL